MNVQQTYHSNTAIPYPFEDGQSSSVPYDIVVDMSLTVPDGCSPVITAVSVGRASVFVSVEDSVTEEAVGQFCITRPSPFKVYDMVPVLSGAFGWIVFGPGIREPAVFPRIELVPDPSVVTSVPANTTFLSSLSKNGEASVSLSGPFRIRSLNDLVSLSVEDRLVTGLGTVKCLVFSRNDSFISPETLYGGLVEGSEDVGTFAKSFGGAFPDESGEIILDGTYFAVSEGYGGGGNIGIVVNRSTEVCSEYERTVRHGKCQLASEYRLPCDDLVEAFNPKYAETDCGCETEEP